jgi:hypothetical protein
VTTYHHAQQKNLAGIADVVCRGNTVDGYDYESPTLNASQLQAAIDAAPALSAQVTQDATDRTGIRGQILSREGKARAIIADPVNAPDWTANERKVAIACLVLFLCREMR